MAHRDQRIPPKEKPGYYIPVTPAGTPVIYGAGCTPGKLLAAKTHEQAIKNLLEDAAHMPYGTWKNFRERGYTIEKWEGWEPDEQDRSRPSNSR